MKKACLAFFFVVLVISATTSSAFGASAPAPNPPPTVQQIQQIIRDALAPLGPSSQEWALRVAKCESGYNPNAINPSTRLRAFPVLAINLGEHAAGEGGQIGF
jgi:hypothetical protein